MPSIFSRLSKSSIIERHRRAAFAAASTLPSTQFAFRLFETLKPGDRNLAISPCSARIVLSMIWEGSTGETRESMLETLRLNEDPNSLANPYERRGRPLGFQREPQRRELELITANSLWCDGDFVLKQDYVNTVKEHYWAEAQTLDFRAPDSVRRVNGWAHDKTRGRIPAIVDSLADYSPLLAINAVYFKGLWINPFKVKDTREEEFTLLDGTKQLLPLMRQSGEFPYAEIAGAQIVSLPYKGSMSMRVVLPPKDMPFPSFCADMTNVVGTNWTRSMDKRDGHLRLPRFRIETQADLTAPLKAMGMSQVFDPALASLEGITDRKPFYLMSVMQKDFVEVNEKGTEAAAVTMVLCGAALNPPPPPPPFQMIVNRPFVFAICDDLSGAIVFLAAVVDPLAG